MTSRTCQSMLRSWSRRRKQVASVTTTSPSSSRVRITPVVLLATIVTLCLVSSDPTMTQTFFAHFRCRDLLEKAVLDYDYEIECSTEDATWLSLALIAFVGIAVVSIGFPMGAPDQHSRIGTCCHAY